MVIYCIYVISSVVSWYEVYVEKNVKSGLLLMHLLSSLHHKTVPVYHIQIGVFVKHAKAMTNPLEIFRVISLWSD